MGLHRSLMKLWSLHGPQDGTWLGFGNFDPAAAAAAAAAAHGTEHAQVVRDLRSRRLRRACTASETRCVRTAARALQGHAPGLDLASSRCPPLLSLSESVMALDLDSLATAAASPDQAKALSSRRNPRLCRQRLACRRSAPNGPSSRCCCRLRNQWAATPPQLELLKKGFRRLPQYPGIWGAHLGLPAVPAPVPPAETGLTLKNRGLKRHTRRDRTGTRQALWWPGCAGCGCAADPADPADQ